VWSRPREEHFWKPVWKEPRSQLGRSSPVRSSPVAAKESIRPGTETTRHHTHPPNLTPLDVASWALRTPTGAPRGTGEGFRSCKASPHSACRMFWPFGARTRAHSFDKKENFSSFIMGGSLVFFPCLGQNMSSPCPCPCQGREHPARASSFHMPCHDAFRLSVRFNRPRACQLRSQ
jgi:hypothetical protein